MSYTHAEYIDLMKGIPHEQERYQPAWTHATPIPFAKRQLERLRRIAPTQKRIRVKGIENVIFG